MSFARETDVLQLPAYSPPKIQDIVDAASVVESAKSALIPEDKISYIIPDEEPLDFDLSVQWAPEELISLATKETTKFDDMPMTLIVRRPDYLGATKWDFRHGRRQISARIEDGEWLRAFQSRAVDVRPGVALISLSS